MRYVALKSEHARETLEALRRAEPVDEQRVLAFRGSGDDIEQVVPPLARTLYEIKSRFPERLRHKRDPAGGAFEAEACAELHRALPFDPQVLGDYEWWTWLAVFHFRQLVDWRHGGERGLAAFANFGIGNGSENLLYRMWLRADAGYDPARSDPYELARRGDQDFWRSHVFRQGYGRCRSLVRALILYQFPDGSAGNSSLKTSEIRELAKRLRRLHPNVFFEYLDANAAYELVKAEAERAKQALPGSVNEQ
jgi:hypothetical protein